MQGHRLRQSRIEADRTQDRADGRLTIERSQPALAQSAQELKYDPDDDFQVRPRPSVSVDHADPSRRSSSPRWNGSTDSIIAGCWSPSATSRRPKPRHATTHAGRASHGITTQTKRPPSNPAAVQFAACPVAFAHVRIRMEFQAAAVPSQWRDRVVRRSRTTGRTLAAAGRDYVPHRLGPR